MCPAPFCSAKWMVWSGITATPSSNAVPGSSAWPFRAARCPRASPPTYRRNIVILSVSTFLVLLLGVWLARRFVGDLTQLRNAARRIAGGDLSPPAVSLSPNLEFSEVQDAFANMALRLRDARGALDRQFDQERKMREMLQSLQRQVVRQERLTAVGLLVSGVAHELNNPLQAILGTVELLERYEGLPPDVLSEITFVKTQSGRAREIIRNLSRFSSQQPGPETLVDLRDVIAEVVQLRKTDLDKASIALDVELFSVRKVNANFTELEQVTLNFVINAQQAVEGGQRSPGRIVIRLTDSGRKVRLEVADNGPGVKPDDEPKLFQPFFTTKPVGKGTGLGLSVSYGIIDSYGGAIGYIRNEWGGATFFFELPAADSPAPESRATNDRAAVLRGSVSAASLTPRFAAWSGPAGGRSSCSTARRSTRPLAASRSTPAPSAPSASSTCSTRTTARSCTCLATMRPAVRRRSPGRMSGAPSTGTRRFDHMQQHSGQHVLSAAFDRMFGARTVSFHLGATSSTIDLDRELSRDDIAAAEAEANRVVWENHPVTIRFVSAE